MVGLRAMALAGALVSLAAVIANDAAAVESAENRCVPREARNTFQGAVVHAPVAEGRCMECHGPHQTTRRLLRETPPELCIGCHVKPYVDEDGRERPAIKALFEAAERPLSEGGVNLHRPVADGNCLCCHDPHASSNPRLLSASHITGGYVTYDSSLYFCLNCHSERAFEEPRTLDATNFRNGNLNLHYRHVNRVKGRPCVICHEYHASTYDALIRKEIPFGVRSITITRFERTETGGTCAPTCHTLAAYDRIEPGLNPIRVTPREGQDASPQELWNAVYPPED